MSSLNLGGATATQANGVSPGSDLPPSYDSLVIPELGSLAPPPYSSLFSPGNAGSQRNYREESAAPDTAS